MKLLTQPRKLRSNKKGLT